MKKELLSIISEEEAITIRTCRPLSQDEADRLVDDIADAVRALPEEALCVTAELAGKLYAATTAVSGEPEEEYDAYVKLAKKMMRRNSMAPRMKKSARIIVLDPTKRKGN